MSGGATLDMAALCSAGMAAVVPTPARIMAGASTAKDAPSPAHSVSAPSPAACRRNPVMASARSPKRPARAPASGATTNSVAVQGSSFSADSKAVPPCDCSSWGNMNRVP